ncbi:hypothetical protein Tco_1059287 [Tanacetum coccineum]
MWRWRDDDGYEGGEAAGGRRWCGTEEMERVQVVRRWLRWGGSQGGGDQWWRGVGGDGHDGGDGLDGIGGCGGYGSRGLRGWWRHVARIRPNVGGGARKLEGGAGWAAACGQSAGCWK